MEVKVLEEKVQKAQEKVAKCQGTIERHQKSLQKKVAILAKAAGVKAEDITLDYLDGYKWGADGKSTTYYWEACEVGTKLSDIQGAHKKLAEAERVLANWEEKLTTELNKEKFINNEIPEAIKEFMEAWKQKAYEWHIKRYDDFQEYSKNLDKHVREAKEQIGVKEGMMTSRAQDKILKEMELDYRTVEKKKAEFAGQTVLDMCRYHDKDVRGAFLDKVLETEKKRKLLDLVYRIKDVVGEITDASGLRVNVKLNLDGIVVGTKGKAKVETIGAGGWNIQCFHFRTLVNKIKGGK